MVLVGEGEVAHLHIGMDLTRVARIREVSEPQRRKLCTLEPLVPPVALRERRKGGGGGGGGVGCGERGLGRLVHERKGGDPLGGAGKGQGGRSVREGNEVRWEGDGAHKAEDGLKNVVKQRFPQSPLLLPCSI